jgi:hypothetical protein
LDPLEHAVDLECEIETASWALGFIVRDRVRQFAACETMSAEVHHRGLAANSARNSRSFGAHR